MCTTVIKALPPFDQTVCTKTSLDPDFVEQPEGIFPNRV